MIYAFLLLIKPKGEWFYFNKKIYFLLILGFPILYYVFKHHNILESCCQLDPASVTAGNVSIGECSHIHMGALIANRINIGANSIVGAGTVVLSDVSPNITVAGVPAKEIQRHGNTE